MSADKVPQDELDALADEAISHLKGRRVVGLIILMSIAEDKTWTYSCQGNATDQTALDLVDMTRAAFLKGQH